METRKDLLFSLVFLLFTAPSIAQNVQVSVLGNATEPSIKMDPKNPNNIVAGSNLNFYYRSTDGGLTWFMEVLSSSYGVWGDPVIDVDSSGNFYFTHLSNVPGGNWIDRIVCQKSLDTGKTWSDGTFTGLNGNKVQDKQWTVVDRKTNIIYMTWTEFDVYASEKNSDSSRILFSRSLDQGATWSAPLKISKFGGNSFDGDSTVEGAVPAVGPSGEVYVSWAGPKGIVFNRSLDQGLTWLPEEILVGSMPGGWAFDVPGIYRTNGLPVTKCDLSGGPNHGTIYINWSDQRNGVDNTDIWICQSKDGGDTWSAPSRVNDDNSNRQQFFTWMDIDQTTGHLYFVFYDRRAYSDNQTDVYMAISSDGAKTFMNRKISESPFIPAKGVFFGDYNNITAHAGIVRPIWTRFENGNLSVWTSVTPLSKLLSSPSPEIVTFGHEAQVYPNPAQHINYISFKLHQESIIKLELFDQSGKSVALLLDHQSMDYGKHIIPVDTEALHLAQGTYYYRLSIDGQMQTLKAVLTD